MPLNTLTLKLNNVIIVTWYCQIKGLKITKESVERPTAPGVNERQSLSI